MSRKKILILVLAVFFALGTMNAGAQVRLDVNVPWIMVGGLTINAFTGDSETYSGNIADLHIPLPHLALAYQFGDGFIKGGIGLRTYTILVEFLGWPMGYVELDLSPVILRAELGGFVGFAFGIWNYLWCDANSLQILVPDISAEFKITDWFRAGVGVNAIAPFGNLDNFGWILYINGRFSFLFQDK